MNDRCRKAKCAVAGREVAGGLRCIPIQLEYFPFPWIVIPAKAGIALFFIRSKKGRFQLSLE